MYCMYCRVDVDVISVGKEADPDAEQNPIYDVCAGFNLVCLFLHYYVVLESEVFREV